MEEFEFTMLIALAAALYLHAGGLYVIMFCEDMIFLLEEISLSNFKQEKGERLDIKDHALLIVARYQKLLWIAGICVYVIYWVFFPITIWFRIKRVIRTIKQIRNS